MNVARLLPLALLLCACATSSASAPARAPAPSPQVGPAPPRAETELAAHAPRDRDGDGDGLNDSRDTCPDEPGVEPDGCPLLDTDADGILDIDDQCVTIPELRNGYMDEDGCPDEIPAKLARFTGAMRGIHFDSSASAGGKSWSPSSLPAPGRQSTTAAAVQAVDAPPTSGETYAHTADNSFVAVADDPVSTFSSEVDA